MAALASLLPASLLPASSAPDSMYALVSSVAHSVLPAQLLATHVSEWKVGKTPLSTSTTVVTAIVTYLAIIFGGQEMMKDRKPKQLRALFMAHNALLSGASLLVLVLMLEEILRMIYAHGPYYAICHRNAWTPRLETHYIMNYFFKYWELADTVFLVLKKKQLQFLHVFHHAATAVLCYTQLNGRTSVSWVVITLNLLVHVLMYYYYFATTAFPGRKIWWKRYLTSLQISQFVVDLFIVYFASYNYFGGEYFAYLNLPKYGSCAGSEGAAIFGCSLLTSYLFLFIAFYKRTYKTPAQKAAHPKAQ